MKTSNDILVASKQYGQAVKQFLKGDAHFEVDLLPKDTLLINQLTKQSYGIVVVDIDLLNSIRLFNQIKATFPNLAILLLASLQQRSLAVGKIQQGATDYLLTPFEAGELKLKLRRMLDLQSFNVLPYTNDARNELMALSQAIQEIIQTLQLDEALGTVLAWVNQIVKVDIAKIWLTDRQDNLRRGESISQPDTFSERSQENTLLFTLAQQAAFSQQVVSQQKSSATIWQNQSIESVLALPLISREIQSGVLVLGSKNPDAFSSRHVSWLSIFCDQAAIALDNARLFHDLSSAYIDLAQSREEILRSRNTLQAIFDGITDGLYILDQDLTINAINQVEAEQQRRNPKDLIGTNYLQLEGIAPQLVKQIKQAIAAGHETTWISPKNEGTPYLKDREFRIYPIRNQLGQTEQIIVFAQDVSERRRWQASLFRSANLAAVGQLAGSVAHQINNPLTVTMTNSQLLLLDTAPHTEAYDLAQGIFKAGERIQKIVGNLLEFANQEEYYFDSIDLIDSIDGALALIVRSLRRFGIQLIKDYQIQPVIYGSASHLKLVWINLLLNAQDAVENVTDSPQVIIAVEPAPDDSVKVAVADNGIGIVEKDLERLFTPFYTTKSGNALGLGLYSARTIVERHGGHINVFSQPTVSTRFEVVLPLNRRDESA